MPLAVSVSTIVFVALVVGVGVVVGIGVVVVVGGDGEGQGTSCWVPAATYPGHVDLHPIGEHVTVVTPLRVELEYNVHVVAVPGEVS